MQNAIQRYTFFILLQRKQRIIYARTEICEEQWLVLTGIPATSRVWIINYHWCPVKLNVFS